jgi:hypothetical protein
MRYRLALMGVVWLACRGIAASAQSASAARQELAADYTRIARSFEKKDTRAIIALAAPDFTMKMGRRMLNARQAERELKREIALIDSIQRVVLTIQNFTFQGKRAIATISVLFVGTLSDDRGRQHSLTMAGVTRDTWVKTPHGWRIQRVDTLKSKSTMDGKPIQ